MLQEASINKTVADSGLKYNACFKEYLIGSLISKSFYDSIVQPVHHDVYFPLSNCRKLVRQLPFNATFVIRLDNTAPIFLSLQAK